MQTKQAARVQPIDIRLKTNPEGEVEPVVEATWAISDNLVDQIANGKYIKPYIVILVAQRIKYDYGYEKGYYHNVTDVYVHALTDTPKAYLRFRHPGENIVMAGILDVSNKFVASALTAARRNKDKFYIEISSRTRTATSMSVVTEYHEQKYLAGQSVKFVDIPKELFAPPPPAWQRALVTQFFPSYAIDECYFWRRLPVAMVASFFVQLYGLPVRIFTLLYGLFMAMRGMQFRSLFALNPHDFARTFNNSFWFVDKDGYPRSGIGWKLTPPWLVIYALIAAGATIVLGGAPLLVYSIKHGSDFGNLNWNELIGMALVVDGIIVLVATIIFFVVNKTANRMVNNAWDRLVKRFEPPTKEDPSEEAKALAEATAIAERASLAELIRQQSDRARAGNVEDDTLYLKVYAHKADTCRPFAGGILG